MVHGLFLIGSWSVIFWAAMAVVCGDEQWMSTTNGPVQIFAAIVYLTGFVGCLSMSPNQPDAQVD